MLNSQEKSRLAWHCRRGMLELDLILQDFLKNKLETLTDEQISSFDLLLNCTDPELFAWFMGYEHPEDKQFHEIIALIRNHHQTN